MLLGYLMDVNLKTRAHLETSLHMATYQRDSRKMQLLIDRGADVNVLDLYNNSILHLALTSGCDVDILNMLLHNDARR
jgi:ankyrin repeat protein